MSIPFTDPDPTDTWLDSPYAHEKPIPNTVDSELLRAVANPADYTVVVSSDNPRWLTGAKRVGAVLDTKSHKLLSPLDSDMNVVWPSYAPIGATKTNKMIAVLSGKRQEVAFFGELEVGGGVYQGYYFYDLDGDFESNKWFFGDDVVLHEPKAATYRAEDDTYYILDKDAGASKFVSCDCRAATLWKRSLPGRTRGFIRTGRCRREQKASSWLEHRAAAPTVSQSCAKS